MEDSKISKRIIWVTLTTSVEEFVQIPSGNIAVIKDFKPEQTSHYLDFMLQAITLSAQLAFDNLLDSSKPLYTIHTTYIISDLEPVASVIHRLRDYQFIVVPPTLWEYVLRDLETSRKSAEGA